MHVLNDVHSRLNETTVSEVDSPATVDELVRLVRQARDAGTGLCVHGGKHAGGGQQFASERVAVSMRGLSRAVAFDREQGLLTIQAGAIWPEVIAATRAGEEDGHHKWGIRQKQTGADDLTIGGSVSCNAHGRGLTMGPFVDDIERLTVITADAEVVSCSRAENAELFSLVVGGYGLFGIVTDVTLRLSPRRKVKRLVDVIDLDDAMSAVARRIDQGCIYGDFQHAIDPGDDSFLRRGVFACYKPVDDDAELTGEGADLPTDHWLKLLDLAHRDKARAFQLYTEHYLATHGRMYWSDLMQLSTYIPSYSDFIAKMRPEAPRESLVISELHLPPENLAALMDRSRAILREHGVEDIYGTIRAIRRDTTTFLPWARGDWACVIYNLRTPHTPDGIARTREAFRSLYDAVLELGGGFYLTYHRWARADQLLRAYPQLAEFLARKRTRDPRGVFRSDWHDHLVQLLGVS